MALTQVSTNGIKNGTIATADLAATCVTTVNLDSGAVTNDKVNANAAIARTKLANVDLVDDTSPQLGGTLDVNSQVVSFDDATGVNVNRAKFGTGNDLHIYHNASDSMIRHEGTGDLNIQTTTGNINLVNGAENMLVAKRDEAVELFYDNSKKFQTASGGFNLQEGNTTRLSFTYSNSLAFITANAGNKLKVSSGNGDANGIEFFDYSGVDKRVTIDGHGLKFNADTAAANALDDYEEGTYTPTPNSGTASNNDGQYTKIGNFCCVTGSIDFDNNGTSGQMVQISLPFTAGSGRAGSGVIRYSNASIADTITIHVNGGHASMDWYQFGGSGFTYGEAGGNRYDFVITYRTV